jgi:hypothetical protein
MTTCLVCFAEAALPKLFEKYTQASTTHARQYGGTGLGLAICKNLVNIGAIFPSHNLSLKNDQDPRCLHFANEDILCHLLSQLTLCG